MSYRLLFDSSLRRKATNLFYFHKGVAPLFEQGKRRARREPVKTELPEHLRRAMEEKANAII